MDAPITQDLPANTEFQAILRLVVVTPNGDDRELEQFAEASLEVLRNEPVGLALGVVASLISISAWSSWR